MWNEEWEICKQQWHLSRRLLHPISRWIKVLVGLRNSKQSPRWFIMLLLVTVVFVFPWYDLTAWDLASQERNPHRAKSLRTKHFHRIVCHCPRLAKGCLLCGLHEALLTLLVVEWQPFVVWLVGKRKHVTKGAVWVGSAVPCRCLMVRGSASISAAVRATFC